jgi:DNA-binding transcriptional LysR family regulator
MINSSFRALRLFEATARLSRLTQAAEEQSISQSAASQSLKELENQLGYALFYRQGRELLLTPEGERALTTVRSILTLADQLKHPFSDAVSGPLLIGASVTIGNYLLPKVLAPLLERHPALAPSIRIANSQQVIEWVAKGLCQIGLIEGPATHSHLTIQGWTEDELWVFGHPEEPDSLDIPALSHHNWIFRERGSGTREIIDLATQRLGFSPAIRLELSGQEAIKQSVKAKLGISCLSKMALEEEIHQGALKAIQTPLELTRQLSFVFDQQRLTPSVEALMEHLEQSALGAT